MFGLKIFVRVQTFCRGPPMPPRNFCHPEQLLYFLLDNMKTSAIIFYHEQPILNSLNILKIILQPSNFCPQVCHLSTAIENCLLIRFGLSQNISIHACCSHTWYLSWAPRAYPCKFFLAGVNFYRFNAKNWQFTVYFVVLTQKNWQFTVYFVVIYAFFRCKFYSPKILPV